MNAARKDSDPVVGRAQDPESPRAESAGRVACASAVAEQYARVRGGARSTAPPPQTAPPPKKRSTFQYALCDVDATQFAAYVDRHLRGTGVEASTARTCHRAAELVARFAKTGRLPPSGGDRAVDNMGTLLDGVADLLAGRRAAEVPVHTLDGIVLRGGYARVELLRDDPVAPVDLWALSTATEGAKQGLSRLACDEEGNIAASVARAWLGRWGIVA